MAEYEQALPHHGEVTDSSKTPLMLACIRGDVDMVTSLLSICRPPQLQAVDADGHTALYYSVKHLDEAHSMAVLEKMWSLGGVPDIKDVFLQASESGHASIITKSIERLPSSKLLELKRYTDSSRRTALHLAVQHRHSNVVSALLQHFLQGTKYDKHVMDKQDDQGYRPLTYAAVAGDVELVRDLLERGVTADDGALVQIAKLSKVTDNHLNVVQLLLYCDADPNAKTLGKTETVLHLAALAGDLELINILRHDKRLDTNAKGEWDMNPLHYLADGTIFRNAVKITEFFMAVGIRLLETDEFGRLPVHFASRRGNIPLLEHLLQLDPGVLSAVCGNGQVALHYGHNNPESLQWLLDHGSDVNATDNHGRSALHLAASAGSWKAVTILQARGGILTVKDMQHRTLLHYAAAGGHLELVSSLLKLKDKGLWSELNVEDIDGWTPLHWACRRDKSLEVAKLLIADGADVNKATKEFWTPAIIAVVHEAVGIHALIKEKSTSSSRGDGSSNTLIDSFLERPWYFLRMPISTNACDSCFISVRQPLLFSNQRAHANIHLDTVWRLLEIH